MSNIQIARHLHISEATVRRLRHKLSSSTDEDAVRVVSRNNRVYAIQTAKIGKGRTQRRLKARLELQAALSYMKQEGSADARRLFNVIEKWAFGAANANDCLEAVERIITALRAEAVPGYR